MMLCNWIVFGLNVQEILKFLREQYLLQLRESGAVVVEGMQLPFKRLCFGVENQFYKSYKNYARQVRVNNW